MWHFAFLLQLLSVGDPRHVQVRYDDTGSAAVFRWSAGAPLQDPGMSYHSFEHF